VSVIFAWFQRSPKTLDWQLVADQPIVGAGSEHFGSSLTVEWETTKLEDPRVISLRIFNSGKREVLDSDYQSPISIVVPGTEIVAAYVINATVGAYEKGPVPVEHNASPRYGDVVELKPGCLNPGDYMTVQLIVDGQAGRANVMTRVAGQSRRIRNVVAHVSLRRHFWPGILALIPFSIAIYLVFSADKMAEWVFLALMVAGMVLGAISLYYGAVNVNQRLGITKRRAVIRHSPRSKSRVMRS
jgi:hypothetical protein